MPGSSELTVAVARSGAAQRRVFVACYAFATTCALAIEGVVSVTAGGTLCALLVVLLLNHHIAWIGAEPDADGIFLMLSLVPLAGVLTVVMPTARVVVAAWPLLAAIPLILAVALTARHLGLSRDALCLTLRCRGHQLWIALLGIPLGFIAYGGLRPHALTGGAVGLAVASLCVLAFTEELLFRGLLQPALLRLYGLAGIAVAAVLSATVALGIRSFPFALFAGVIAGGFGVASQRTGSIAGTTAARALLFVGLLIVWPQVLG